VTVPLSERRCAYCAEPNLTGEEPPEHPFAAAIKGRFVTYTVCQLCNEWAGEAIDQPWLNDVHVGHVRFLHAIPDRRGDVLKYDPLLAGVTADGRQIRLGRDGKPVALNSPVHRDRQTGEVQIHAKDEEHLNKLVERERRRAEAAGKHFHVGEPDRIEDQPEIRAKGKIFPSVWERMAAKIALALLAETQSADWRTSGTAADLRAVIHGPNRPQRDVAMLPGAIFAAFAPSPCSALVIATRAGRAYADVSLIGAFAFSVPLGAELVGADVAWVSDPKEPSGDVRGTFAEVVAARG
jgi:hypothetical protein